MEFTCGERRAARREPSDRRVLSGNFLYLVLPAENAMGYTAIFHVILAGLFMYAYLRDD